MNLTLLEPESDFLLGVLDTVGTVADVTSDIDGEVAADGTWGRCKGVGGTEESWKGSVWFWWGENRGVVRTYHDQS